MKTTTIFNELKKLLQRNTIGVSVSKFIELNGHNMSNHQLCGLIQELSYACDNLDCESVYDSSVFLEYLASRFYINEGVDFIHDGLTFVYDDNDFCWYVFDDDGNIYLDIGEIPTEWYMDIDFSEDFNTLPAK